MVFPEPDILRDAPIEDRRAERAALADETNVAGPGHRAGEGRIESGERAHHTQAMGPMILSEPRRACLRACRSTAWLQGPLHF